MKKYVALILLITINISLFFILKKAGSIWILAAFAGSLWLTLEAVLKHICNYIKQRNVEFWIIRLSVITADIIKYMALLFAFIYCFQDVALFHPNSSPFSHTYVLTHKEFTEIIVNNGSGSYKGIIRKSNETEPSPLIIFFIGNAQNAAQTMRLMDSSRMWDSFYGCNFLIMDYPGYGLNSGMPSADSIFKEALLAYDYAAGQPYIDKNRIIIGGFSIGTGPAVYLASKRDSAGLFLLAPYANGYDLYNNVVPVFHGPLRLLVKHKFMSDRYASSITAPVLIVASKNDETVPFSSSERLCASFPTEPIFITLSGVRHNEIMPDKITLSSIKDFLNSIK